MSNVLGGAVLFLALFLVTNFVLIKVYKCTYTNSPRLYLSLFAVCISLLAVSNDAVSSLLLWENVVFVVLATMSYAYFSHRWQLYNQDSLNINGLGLPDSHVIILRKSSMNGVVKVTEIVVQQLCVFVIMVGLSQRGLTRHEASFWLPLAVFILHLPGLRVLGMTFGLACLVASTVASIGYPHVYDWYFAFGVLVCLHTLAYVFWYHFGVPYFDKRHKEKPRTLD